MFANLGSSPTVPKANFLGTVVSILYPAPEVLTPSAPATLLIKSFVLPFLNNSLILDLPVGSTTG